jgi:four helix bundle protein
VTPEEIRHRTGSFVHRVRRQMQPLLGRTAATQAAAQASRAAIAVADACRRACLARSDAEFGAALERSVDELEETTFWLEVLRLTEDASSDAITALIADGRDLGAWLRGAAAAPRRR